MYRSFAVYIIGYRGGSLPRNKSLETSLICFLLSVSRDVHFDKRMICFLSGLL